MNVNAEELQKQGGVAFPSEVYGKGMTLRDYFAAAALTGLCACDDGEARIFRARSAYAYADAMLTARKESAKGKP